MNIKINRKEEDKKDVARYLIQRAINEANMVSAHKITEIENKYAEQVNQLYTKEEAIESIEIKEIGVNFNVVNNGSSLLFDMKTRGAGIIMTLDKEKSKALANAILEMCGE